MNSLTKTIHPKTITKATKKNLPNYSEYAKKLKKKYI